MEDNYNFTLILSIGILILSIFIMAMNYSERALKAQILYTQLDYLYAQVKGATNATYECLYKQYTDLINLTENHSETYDYLTVKYELKNVDKIKYPNPPAPTCTEQFFYWFYKIRLRIIEIFLFAFPLLLVLGLKFGLK